MTSGSVQSLWQSLVNEDLLVGYWFKGVGLVHLRFFLGLEVILLVPKICRGYFYTKDISMKKNINFDLAKEPPCCLNIDMSILCEY